MKRLAVILVLAILATLLASAWKRQVSPSIEGKWVMPSGGFMGYSLSLAPSGGYTRWFWSDVVNASEVSENPKSGQFEFADGWLNIPVEHRYQDGTRLVIEDRFNRESINGLEVLLREDAESIWRRCGMIYTGGLLIKVSDDPTYSETKNEPDTRLIFRNGVTDWLPEAEAAKNTKQAAPSDGGKPSN